jgi:hypothetical protein
MDTLYSWSWVEEQSAATAALWHECTTGPMPEAPRFTLQQQHRRERAYDRALLTVEDELKRASRNTITRNPDAPGLDSETWDTATLGAPPSRRFLPLKWAFRSPRPRINSSIREQHLVTQARVTEAFAQFAAQGLDLTPDAIELLTRDFLPAGTQLARWARAFDPSLSMPDIIQASRNAWTACGLQPLFGEPQRLTPSILGYSLIYPYSDNLLDREDLSSQAKLQFSARFRQRLHGEDLTIEDPREFALQTMIHLIESEYPRDTFPHVYQCLLAIHQAQENSLRQLRSIQDPAEILAISCAKGGTSVLADAILTRGWLTEAEIQFAFEWGVLLQLGDDLQDLVEDQRRGSVTLFTRAAAQGIPLDRLTRQLLRFSDRVAYRMDQLPHATPVFRSLLRMAWRSLILCAIAYSHKHFSKAFLAEAESISPFRFSFLRARRDRLAGRRGLYKSLFEAFLEAPDTSIAGLPDPQHFATALTSRCNPAMALTN